MCRSLVFTILIAWAATAAGQEPMDANILSEPIDGAILQAIDFAGNGNGKIDDVSEVKALVRYVNSSVFKTYDTNHDGKLTDDEAARYVAQRVQPNLDKYEEFFRPAYKKAEANFTGGVDIRDEAEAFDRTPIMPTVRTVAFSAGWGTKDDPGKDVESINSGLEYSWGSASVFEVPVVASFKLNYSRENTFVDSTANKIERWSFEPARLTIGADKWSIMPVVSLGYGKTEIELLDAAGDRTRSSDDEIVWGFGVDVPLKVKWATLSVSQVVRQDNLFSGKRSDELVTGVKINLLDAFGWPKP